jgi:D-2-hydroxyacid dehydrogenase (NADP+)
MDDKVRILVVNPLSEHQICTLQGVDPTIEVTTCEFKEIPEYIADTDILVPWGWMDISPFFASANKLRWIQTLSAGVEKIIFPAFVDSDVLLSSARGIHGIPVSEHVLAMMLAFTRGLHLTIPQQGKKMWHRVPTDEIHEKTVGIIGLGSIGREIAKKCKALNMRVIAIKQAMTEELFIDLLLSPKEMDRLIELSDYVVLAVPLTEATHHLIDADRLQKMRKSAYLINISRGQVVDESALVDALREGRIRGAGLDVFASEPLPTDHPLWDFNNVIITPHNAALSPYYLDRAIALIADNIARFLQGREMLNVIDKQKGY